MSTVTVMITVLISINTVMITVFITHIVMITVFISIISSVIELKTLYNNYYQYFKWTFSVKRVEEVLFLI